MDPCKKVEGQTAKTISRYIKHLYIVIRLHMDYSKKEKK